MLANKKARSKTETKKENNMPKEVKENNTNSLLIVFQ